MKNSIVSLGPLQAELATQTAALQKQVDTAEAQRQQAAAAQARADAACAAAERAAAESAAQLAVVMETLEVLQSGSADAQQEHVLGMTADLAAAQAGKAALEQRCTSVEWQLEAARSEVGECTSG